MSNAKSLPTLYKTDSKGKVRIWEVEYNYIPGHYRVVHGAKGGKMQETTVKVEAKNVGRANEKDEETQAYSEAYSLWKKKQDSGYALSIQPTTSGAVTRAKLLLPMLAQKFQDSYKKIEYPCYVQPKLDGIRCVSHIYENDPRANLVSRKGKEFKLIKHINEAVAEVLANHPELVLDGELFSKSLGFDEITSIAKQSKTVHDNADALQYHIYDCFHLGNNQIPYKDRLSLLSNLLKQCKLPLVLVNTDIVECEDDVAGLLRKYEQLGYEGIMLRNANGIYEQDRRSPNLQKVKSFTDDEFEIVGGKSGIGKDTGTVIFKCSMPNGATFDVRPMGDHAKRSEYLTNLNKYIGKQLIVKYFELTKDGVPRFPTGIEIRDYE